MIFPCNPFMIALLLEVLTCMGLHAGPDAASSENASARDAAATAVVYNEGDPVGKDLADFYCSARHIDPAHEIALSAPLSEEISRPDYEKTIESPLVEEFVKRGYWQFARGPSGKIRLVASQVSLLVLIKGMPLKIAPWIPPLPPSSPASSSPQSSPQSSHVATPHGPSGSLPSSPPAPPVYATCNSASVDSELSMMGCFQHPTLGPLGSPYCIKKRDGMADPHSASDPDPDPDPLGTPPPKKRIPPGYLMVARLDGPTAECVRSMVLDGIRAEHEGLWGWGITDLRSLTDGTYKLGDDWIRIAAAAMRQNGIPVLCDDLPETIHEGFPLPEVSAYYGWYSGTIDGPFADPGFRFQSGAVAFHLHSFSASTLRNPKQGWTGPLLMHGAAASLGNVYEPYLGFTTDLGTLARMLLAGHTLVESYYAAQPVLSWMSVLVGDPLYRPYARLRDPAGSSTTKWSDYRRIILAHHGSVLDAAAELRRRSREKHESLYLEALGAAQYDAGDYRDAESSFEQAAAFSTDPSTSFRLVLERVRAIEKQGDPSNKMKVISLLSKSLEGDRTDDQKKLLLHWMHRIDPKSCPFG